MSDRSISLRDAQALIDEIRFRVQSEQQTRTPELEKLAADYRTLSRECNDRLRECDSLLKRGLLSEALHFAEQEPSLLDLMAQVDFPQRTEWLELIGLYDLPEPQPPLSEVARALNEAYAQSVSLDKLLARHRWLALARAPLGDRCKVLRLLKASDPGNPFWEDDLRDLERAWFQEAEAAIEAAASQKDAAALRGLVADLSSPDLQERPPTALVKSAKMKLALAAKFQARKTLAQLDAPLNDALAALDRPRALDLRALWIKHLAIAQLSQDDPLAIRVGPVLAWLEDGDREAASRASHARAEATLSSAMDDRSTSVARLEELARGVSLTGLEPNPVIATQYSHALAAAKLRERRKSSLMVAGAVAAGLLVVAAIVTTVIIRDRNDRLSAMVARINNLLERDGVEDARKLLDEHGDLKTATKWVASEKVVVEAEERERRRALEFAAAMKEVREGADNAEIVLRRLRQTEPRGDAERREWTALDTELVAILKRQREETERRLGELIEEVEKGLASINDLLEDAVGLDGTDRGLTSIEQPLKSAEVLAEKSDSSWRNAVQALRKRSQYHRERLMKARRRIELETILTDNSHVTPGQPGVAAKLDAFVNAFRAYSKEFPAAGAGQAGDLEAERVLWWGELQLRAKLEQLPKSLAPPPELVAVRLTEMQSLKSTVGMVPDLPVLDNLIEFVQSVGYRSHGQSGPGSDGARAKMTRLLDERIVNESYTLVHENNIFYLQKRDAFNTLLKTGDMVYSVGYLPDETKKKRFSDKSVLANKKLTKSPQMILAEKHRSALATKDESRWLEVTEAFAQELLDDREWNVGSGVVDPLLRYRLLRGLLVQAGDGHAPLREALRPILPQLQDPDLDIDAKWMDPMDGAGFKARLRAQAILRRSTGVMQAWNVARAKEKDLDEKSHVKIEAAGWMTRGTGTNWRVRTSVMPKASVELLAIVPSESDGVASWERIGRLGVSGFVPSSEAKPTAFREGRLVFTRVPSSSGG